MEKSKACLISIIGIGMGIAIYYGYKKYKETKTKN